MGTGIIEAISETGSVWLAASVMFALATGWALLRALRADRDGTEPKG